MGILAIGAQAIYSSATLILGVYVGRTLGVAELGRFSVLLVMALLLIAVQTAWVGDSLTVLRRDDAAIRGGLSMLLWAFAGISFVACALAAYGALALDIRAAGAFGLAVAIWQVEEFGRRTLMARLEFGKLILVDGTYTAGIATGLLIVSLGGVANLAAVFLVMASSGVASYVVAALMLPPAERLGRPCASLGSIATVSGFGLWRAAESGLAYVSQLGVRYVVIGFASIAAVGRIEAARLLIAPLITALAGLGNLILPAFMNSRIRISARLNRRMTVATVIAIATYASVLFACSGFVARHVFDDRVSISTPALLGWLVVAWTVAMTIPYRSALLANGESRPVFLARAVGAGFGVACAVVLTLALGPMWAPLAIGVGNGIGLWMIVSKLHSSRDSRAATDGTSWPAERDSGISPQRAICSRRRTAWHIRA